MRVCIHTNSRDTKSFAELSMFLVLIILLDIVVTLLIMSVVATPTTYVSVVNPTTGGYVVTLPPNTPPGTKFLVNLTVTDVNILRCYQVNLTWNPALLNISDIGSDDPETGDLFAPSDHIFKYDSAPVWFDKRVDNTHGRLLWGVALHSASLKGFNGSGTLCQIRFTTVKDGTTEPTSSTLNIVTTGFIITKLITANAALIPFTARDGLFKYIVGDSTPPTTVDNYDGLWHTSDFFINLTATDNVSGVLTTYYKINSGSTMNVGSNGQPKITTEGTNNTLEYWSLDKAGNEEIPHKTVTNIKLDKRRPIANAGNDQIVNEDTPITFEASNSTDENGITSYVWTPTDVTNQTLSGKSPTYTFTTPGIYAITLEVTDPAGNYATNTIVITVLDVTKPIPYVIHSVRSNLVLWVANFDAAESSDNVGVVCYEWSFGDGSNGTGQIISHTYIRHGVYNVTLTVRDAAGNSDSKSMVVTILPPTSPWWTPIIIAAITIFGIITTLTITLRKRNTFKKQV